MARNKVQDRVLHVLLNLVPAHAFDLAARLSGRKPAGLVRRLGRLREGIGALEFFANRQWSWANDNVAQLSQELNSTGGNQCQSFTVWSNWILQRKRKCYVCCLIDIFLYLR